MVDPDPVMEVVPPPEELTIVVTLRVVPSGSELFAISEELVVDAASSVTVQFSFPFPGSSLTAFTVI